MTEILAEAGWSFDVLAECPGLPGTEPDVQLAGPAMIRVFPVPRRVSRSTRLVRRLRAPAAAEGIAGGSSGSGLTRTAGAKSSLARDEVRWTPVNGQLLRRTVNATLDTLDALAWADAFASTGRVVAQRGTHDLIISSGPPHLAHEAARRLSGELGIPFVMDMRDPWSLQQRLVGSVASPLWFSLAEWQEARCARAAALIIANTEAAHRALAALYPDLTPRMLTVMNGWDDPPFRRPRPTRFDVSYIGTVYLDRNPRLLFEGFRRMLDSDPLAPGEGGITFMGPVESLDGVTVEQLAKDAGIGPYVRIQPAGSREEAMEVMKAASVLVSLPQDSDLAIPSKVFDYMTMPARLLALATPDSATGRVMAGLDGDLIHPDDVDGVAAALRTALRLWRRGEVFEPPGASGQYSRHEQAAKLLARLEEVRRASGRGR